MVLRIKTAADMKLSSVGVYASTSTALFCTRFGEGFERVPKVLEQNQEIKNAGNFNQINVVEILNNSCRSELKGLSVKVIHPKIDSAQGSLEINATNANQDQNIQKLVYKKITSPYGDFYAIGGGNDHILVGPNGIANAEISIEE
jgi:hypothetical protein